MFWTNFILLLLMLASAVVLYYFLLSINLRILKVNRSDFKFNEAFALYMGGVFVSFSFILESVFTSLQVYINMSNWEGLAFLGAIDFYWTWLQLLGAALLITVVLFAFVFIFFAKLTFSINEFRDLLQNERKSGILLGAIFIGLTWACKGLIDIIIASFINSHLSKIR